MAIPSITWKGQATAISSISHTGDTRGTMSLLRREQIIQPDRTSTLVPIISGNSLRGILRRQAEELLRDALGYEGQISVSAAAALRSGGALVKTTAEPLSGSRLETIRTYLPLVGVFGTAAGGRIIDGCLQVGKLIPLVAETNHLTGAYEKQTATDVVQIESYSRVDDTNAHNSPTMAQAGPDTSQMLYHIETFRPGTHFQVDLHLGRPTDIEAAFFNATLAAFAKRAHVGGRAAIGLGHIRLDVTPDRPVPGIDSLAWLAEHREQALDALTQL